MSEKNSHCSYCGELFHNQTSFPRTCAACSNVTYRNPTPVTVVLLPIMGDCGKRGLLVVRRNIEPQKGKLALPGGFVNFNDKPETWQEAGARELYEETGVEISPNDLFEYKVRSSPSGSLLIFAQAMFVFIEEQLPTFLANEEATERGVIWEPQELAFPLHTEMVQHFFETQESARKYWEGVRNAAR